MNSAGSSAGSASVALFYILTVTGSSSGKKGRTHPGRSPGRTHGDLTTAEHIQAEHPAELTPSLTRPSTRPDTPVELHPGELTQPSTPAELTRAEHPAELTRPNSRGRTPGSSRCLGGYFTELLSRARSGDCEYIEKRHGRTHQAELPAELMRQNYPVELSPADHPAELTATSPRPNTSRTNTRPNSRRAHPGRAPGRTLRSNSTRPNSRSRALRPNLPGPNTRPNSRGRTPGRSRCLGGYFTEKRHGGKQCPNNPGTLFLTIPLRTNHPRPFFPSSIR